MEIKISNKAFGLFRLGGFGLGLGCVIAVLDLFFPELLYEKVWVMYACIFAIYAFSSMIIPEKKEMQFMFLFGALILRFFLAFGCAAVFVFVAKAKGLDFGLNYILIYLSFLGFEIYSLID